MGLLLSHHFFKTGTQKKSGALDNPKKDLATFQYPPFVWWILVELVASNLYLKKIFLASGADHMTTVSQWFDKEDFNLG